MLASGKPAADCTSCTGQRKSAEHVHTHSRKLQRAAQNAHAHVQQTIPASCKSQHPGIEQLQRTDTCERACSIGTGQNSLAEHARTHTAASSSIRRTPIPASTPSPRSCSNPAPSKADAAHRHARAGLRERNGPKPTRGPPATRPATSQHRVGRRRRGSDEWRRTSCFLRESFLDAFHQGSCEVVTFFTGKKPRGSLGLTDNAQEA